jgi:hypothetical protein
MLTRYAIYISDFETYFNMFSVKVLEKIFQHYGELEKGCFSLSDELYTDGSSNRIFYYPTDFSEKDAEAFVVKIQDAIGNKTIHELFMGIP